MSISSHQRTSKHATFRLRCSERTGTGHDKAWPVQLVVFDLDETLTLVTYLLTEADPPNVQALLTKIDFESPWVEGRLAKLHAMLEDLSSGEQGHKRTLAVLTRNSSDISNVLLLLKAAKLLDLFSAVWICPHREASHNGAYKLHGEWKLFDPPVSKVPDHKADILHHVAANTSAWLPQLAEEGAGSDDLRSLLPLRPEGIVLVDDQRANFQSETGKQVIRYCKVARYDAKYRDMGLLRNMGGIGAHSDDDFVTLKRFVEDPSVCMETHQVHCLEHDFEGIDERPPVKLIVFDFDETLTLATFMPPGHAFRDRLGAHNKRSALGPWSERDLLAYNFHSPYVNGDRVAKLRAMLQSLKQGEDGQERALAVLTQNEDGVVAVLNLLSMANLADHFSAVWTYPLQAGGPNAAYEEAGHWTLFKAPVANTDTHKADVLIKIAKDPVAWFPQLKSGGKGGGDLDRLCNLRPPELVLVDDERASFHSDAAGQVPRTCKVARYDDNYRDCGPLNQLGGLGAHSDEDYATLRRFVERPWDFHYKPAASAGEVEDGEMVSTLSMNGQVQRSHTSEELGKIRRQRTREPTELSADALPASEGEVQPLGLQSQVVPAGVEESRHAQREAAPNLSSVSISEALLEDRDTSRRRSRAQDSWFRRWCRCLLGLTAVSAVGTDSSPS